MTIGKPEAAAVSSQRRAPSMGDARQAPRRALATISRRRAASTEYRFPLDARGAAEESRMLPRFWEAASSGVVVNQQWQPPEGGIRP